MSSSNRNRRELSPPPQKGFNGPSKLRMDRKPGASRITDPSNPAGKRKEIDNVMKKARAFPNDGTWDKKLLEVEEKDPNRWRHTGYKKMYIEDGSSSDSDERFGPAVHMPGRRSRSRSRSRIRKTPPSPEMMRRRSPPMNVRKPIPESKRRPRSPRSPQEMMMRRKSPKMIRTPPRRSPEVVERRRLSPVPKPRQPMMIPRSKRPPSPRSPPKGARSPSMSSSDDSCSVCSNERRARSRSRSVSIPRARALIRSSPHQPVKGSSKVHAKVRPPAPVKGGTSRISPSPQPTDPRRKPRPEKPKPPSPPVVESTKEISPKHRMKPSKSSKEARRHKERSEKHMRARVKIEGEKHRSRRSPSSGSDDSSSSGSSLPRFTATTRLTLSERFGKMAQWSVDRSNMENMRITKNSAGGDLKVMIEEGLRDPPQRYDYTPAPVGHFPDELMTTCPVGLSSWDDVRVRYEYYKGRGYLRDLDLQDYIKWEEWWYKYQEWLKQERYYEMWERSNMNYRRRKKIPISQRLN